ncbi:enoyl-CoA hydratase-related protein [Kribbella sp. NBC_00889]|uniref:enoyl-CoA hydratase-related protein n=1 Tax=Kribbella sp. NBC_00889 TaxID=2975974 RepID=UPI00386BFBE1|nr:enoyl-CoA hydratase-related protein [Kribbella sp. NBC_00889]
MSTPHEHLSTRQQGAITVVTLDRGPVNAVNLDMYEEIRDLFGRFDEVLPGTKAVVLTGAGKHFCAGNELEEFLTLTEVNSAGRMRLVRDAFASIYDCPVPVIGAVHGAALGTGLAIAASCDVVVAGESARFGTPEVSVGVMGGARHLARLLPQPLVRAMYFTAEPWPASELVQYGAVLRVVPDDELLDVALGLAEKMTRHSLAALRHAKEAMNTVEFMDLKAGYEFEQRMTGRLAAEADAKEAIAALRENRKPAYSDRLGRV